MYLFKRIIDLLQNGVVAISFIVGILMLILVTFLCADGSFKSKYKNQKLTFKYYLKYNLKWLVVWIILALVSFAFVIPFTKIDFDKKKTFANLNEQLEYRDFICENRICELNSAIKEIDDLYYEIKIDLNNHSVYVSNGDYYLETNKKGDIYLFYSDYDSKINDFIDYKIKSSDATFPESELISNLKEIFYKTTDLHLTELKNLWK